MYAVCCLNTPLYIDLKVWLDVWIDFARLDLQKKFGLIYFTLYQKPVISITRSKCS